MESPDQDKKGYVYILFNAAFPGFVKIGRTTKNPEVRAREVSSGSGVLTPFAVAWEALVSDCGLVERMIHQQLAPVRARKDREFFALPLKRAIAVVSETAAPFVCETQTHLQFRVEEPDTTRPEALTVEVSMSDKAATLGVAWRTAYPEAPAVRFLEKHVDFCGDLTRRVLHFGNEVEIFFDPMSIIFSHGERSFFGITPQLSKVLLAPLPLEVAEISDLDLGASRIRDISKRHYKLGGLFRLEVGNNLSIEVAEEIARRSFTSPRKIRTSSLAKIKKPYSGVSPSAEKQ